MDYLKVFLDQITDESFLTFFMPSADIYLNCPTLIHLRCEAEESLLQADYLIQSSVQWQGSGFECCMNVGIDASMKTGKLYYRLWMN